MSKLRVGVIGTGRIAEGSRLPCLSRYRDVELVLCEQSAPRLAQMAEKFRKQSARPTPITGRCSPVSSWTRYSCSPRRWPCFAVARDCLAARVPVLMEKPPGMATARDARTGGDRPPGRGLRHGRRRPPLPGPLLTQAKAMIEANSPIATVIVEFYHFHMEILRGMGASEEGLAQVLTSGCIHSIDLMRYLCGEVTEVYAHAHNYFDRHPDSFTALVRFAGGATADLPQPPARRGAQRLTIHGRHASAYLEGLAQRCVVHQNAFTYDLAAVEHADPSAPQWADKPRQPYLNGWWDQDRYFLDCVRDGHPPAYPAADLDDAVRAIELIDGAIREQVRGPIPTSAAAAR